MPPSSTKPPSPAELAKLEAAFASDPGSETYKPLAEAYLSMGRFMEAMVVCKKGVKAHPTKPDPRILLARVYADQGKDKKALEELAGALQIAPDDRVALRMTGSLQLKNGEPEAGKANLLKAYEKDPNDSDTLAALSHHNIPVAQAAPPPPAPVAAPQFVAPPQQMVGSPQPGGYAAPAAPPPTMVPNVAASSPAPQQPQRVNGAHAPSQPAPAARREAPAPRPAPRRTVSAEHRRYEDDEDEYSGRSQKPKSKAPMVMFMLLLIAGGGGVGAYTFIRKQQRDNVIAVKRIMDGVDKELRHDSYPSYQKIAEQSEKALEIIPDNVPAHGQAAYAYTILWGEHGGGDQARQKAEDHLHSAEKGGNSSASLVAARALFDTYSGKGKEARNNLEGVVKDAEDRGVAAAAQVYLALGLIAMQQGDLAKAKEALDKAQKAAGSDPRVYAALGNLYQRMGQETQAEQNFLFALRFEKGHPESMLGSALLELDKQEPDYAKVALILKTLTEAEPAPSPRQLATAHLARSLMISRVSNEIGSYKAEFQKPILDATKVPTDKAKAQAEVQKAEQLGFGLDKSNPELKLLRAKRLLHENNVDAAVTDIREAIKQDPSRAQFYVELAKALTQKQGGEKEATEALRTAIKSMGESPRLSAMLGQVLIKQGKTDEAIAELQKAVAAKGKNPDARLVLGNALREKRQTDKAIEQLQKASEEFLGNNPKVAEAQVGLGRAYEDKGDKKKAEEEYLAALTADAQYAPGYFFLGRILSAEKANKNKVKGLMKKYLELDPRGPHADDAKRIGDL